MRKKVEWVKYITTNLANQIKLKLEKVCKKTSFFIEWITTGKKHIHLLHKISSLYIPLYKNVKAKQKNRENSYNYLYLYGQEEKKMQKITKIKWAVKREDMILIEIKVNKNKNFALQRSSSPQALPLSLTPANVRT